MTDQTSTRARAHLLPCPFCGCADVILTFYSGAPAIFCTNDDCEALMGGEEYSGDKARLIKCWNRRAPTPDSVDARRYRFVRLHDSQAALYEGDVVQAYIPWEEDLDAAIDAAMKEAQ
ncbi:Lar family restriction alleviation protein [Burkholderia gladioli]|uniref:Lar family restriction alleviation protein n=1 Tax=Burkholderia gladioli TaxID=28095 RepID=UPI000BBD3E79|nr:Lar family restriction alleviation protein [Burkholderia gladioli]ATF86898.1 hypothetical protein CO712_18865 [Burkholderia gladioli pv. gladioli]